MAFLKADALERLLAAHRREKLGHAYLVTGPNESGKEELALDLAAHLLGTSPAAVRTHPDFYTIKPESKSRRIVIEQIRNLETGLRRKSSGAGRKIAVMYDAERLQPGAANAFLKTLEEPPAQTHLLLLSALPEAMLETVLSRCIKLPLRPLSETVEVSEREAELLNAVGPLLNREHPPTIVEVFQFVRDFQRILNQAREEIAADFEAALDQEKAHYKNATDGAWVDAREEQNKAQAESAAVRERQKLLQIIALAVGKQLTQVADASNEGGREERKRLIRQIEAIERLRSDLERNVNEALALEAGFLEVFLPLE